MMEETQAELQQLKSQGSSPSQLPSQPGQTMTDQQIEEYNANPSAYISKMVDQKLSSLNQKVADDRAAGERDRLLDFKVNMAKSRAEGNPMFKDLKEDAMKILNTNILDYHPDAVGLAYHAARSIRMPEIVAQAKNAAFNEGYQKAKDELTKHVEGGGASTLPAGGVQLNKETIDKMSEEEKNLIIDEDIKGEGNFFVDFKGKFFLSFTPFNTNKVLGDTKNYMTVLKLD